MKCHLAVSSDLQSRPVVLIALLKDNAFAGDGVLGHSEQFDSCIRCRDPSDAGVWVYLECRLTEVECVTITMCNVMHPARIRTECFTYFASIKLYKSFTHI